MTSLQGLTSLLSGGRLRSSTSNLSRSLTRPSRLIVLLLLFVACLAFIGLGPFGHTERLSTHLNTLHEVYHDYKQSGECAGWDPRVGKEGSHPGCLKARQWEQVGRAIRMEERPEEHSRASLYWLRPKNIETLNRIRTCFLPLDHPERTTCPRRPLIITSYWYSAMAVDPTKVNGEALWLRSLIEFAEKLGYEFVYLREDYKAWAEFTLLLPDVYHLNWAEFGHVVTCVIDPLCILPEHYTPIQGNEHEHYELAEGETWGNVPISRLYAIDWWGSFPRDISEAERFWGINHDGDWSYHPLGNQWIMSPYAYPGHLYLPFSIEPICTKLPITEWSKRKNAALVLSKLSSYFHTYTSPWFDELFAQDPDFEVISAAVEDEEFPIPEGIVQVGFQERDAYEQLVGSVRGMLGIGLPVISPSVWTALCQGTPVIMPSLVEDATLDGYGGWEKFSITRWQHGIVSALGEPYAYTYYFENTTELKEKVERAMRTPIQRYIPPEMRYDAAFAVSKKWIESDHEGAFRRIVRNDGGRVPAQPKWLYDTCLVTKYCFPTLREQRWVPRT